MTKGHGYSLGVFSLLLLSTCIPLVSASGSGLLMSGDSFTISGDQEVGSGDINISIDIVAHGISSNGSIEMTFTAEDSTPLASDNRSISLSAGESSTETFDISGVPIGTHTLTLQLWGDVGISFENNVSQIQLFVQKLSPANASIESNGTWLVTPINSQTGEESGNSTIRDGDQAWLIAMVSNSGDVPWQGNSTISVDGVPLSTQQTTIDGLTTTSLNFTIGPLFEGTSSILVELLEDQSLIDSATMGVDIGPPPLPRPILSMVTNHTNPDLGDSINWSISVDNTGESTMSGIIQCSFPSGVEILNQSITIPPLTNQTWVLSIDVRPGELFCITSSNSRIHTDSVTSTSNIYDMSAGHLMRAGSDGLTVTGGPFHVGDSAPLAILIHNGGDFSGTGSLEVREGDSEGGGFSNWSTLETRTLEVGSSLELGSEYTTLVHGERTIEWRIVSQDSLVASDLSGSMSLNIQPSQSLDLSIISNHWTLEEGLSIEVTTTLSAGESRLVLLEAGTSGASGELTQISTEIFLSPGQRTLTYDLGHPFSSSDAWVELTPISWMSSTIAQDQITLVHPNPVVSVVIHSVSPTTPVPGEPATISYSLINEGNADTLTGDLMLIDMKRDGEVLWPKSGTEPVDSVSSGENHSGTISLEQWPEGSVVDVSLIWHTSNTDATGVASFLSQAEDSTEAESTIDWMSIVYGSLAGLFIGLVTRTVMRARAGVPLLSRRERGERKSKPKKSPSKVAEEKVEVACPACDQRLRVPASYSGSARCPACAQTFPVEASEEEPLSEIEEEVPIEETVEPVEQESEHDPEPVLVEQEKTSSSSDDVIRCPDCEQKLKVPYNRRPVRARCPACKCEFRALQE